MLQQAQFGPTGCRGCSGFGEHALAATQSNSSQAKHVRLTGSSPCSLYGRFAACFAGGVITGFHSEARNEHFDIGLDSHLERSSATPHVEALRANPELSDRCAECRRCAKHGECAGRQHGTVSARVRANSTFEDYKHLQLTGRESRANTTPLYECSCDTRLAQHGENSTCGRVASSSAACGPPHIWRAV
jgi:hypothetical protein